MKLRPEAKRFLQQVSVLFYGMLAGLVAIGFAFYLIGRGMNDAQKQAFQFLNYIAPLSGIALVLLGQRIFLNKVRSYPSERILGERMLNWQQAMLIRMVLIDGAALLNLVALALTGNALFILLSLVLVGLFILQRPRINNLIRDLKLSTAEQAQLMEKNA